MNLMYVGPGMGIVKNGPSRLKYQELILIDLISCTKFFSYAQEGGFLHVSLEITFL